MVQVIISCRIEQDETLIDKDETGSAEILLLFLSASAVKVNANLFELSICLDRYFFYIGTCQGLKKKSTFICTDVQLKTFN